MIERLDQYIEKVLENKHGRHGLMEVLKVKRHVADLKRDDIFFDSEKAERAISIIEKLRLVEDVYSGKKFKLLDHQCFFYASIFGWQTIDSDTKKVKRRFVRSYKTTGRKNAKTTENSALSFFMLYFDGTNSAQCYSVANTRRQALICHDAAKSMIELARKDSAHLASSIRVLSQSIVVPSTRSRMEAMAADPKRLDGFNPSFTSVDEFHEMKDNKILKIFENGMIMREQPLISITTTAGFNKLGPCYRYQKMCENILRGIMNDDSIFIDIYRMDDEDDIEDENNWYKANPMLGKVISLDSFRKKFISAKNEGLSSMINFKTKNLNMWLSTSKGWIPDSMIKDCMIDEPIKDTDECHIGIDLAAVSDIATVSCYYPPSDTSDFHRFRTKYYISLDKIEERSKRDGVPYLEWQSKGLLSVIDSNVIELSYIIKDVLELCENSSVVTVNVDPWNGREFAAKIAEEGVPIGFFRAGFGSMSEPTKNMEKIIRSGFSDFGKDPIKRWMFSNIELKTDPAGNIKPDKEKSTEKIDGVVSDIIAIGGYLVALKEGRGSQNNRQGIRSI